MVSPGRRPELILHYPMEDDYLYLEGHEPHCSVMGNCCDGCLKLNGFDIKAQALINITGWDYEIVNRKRHFHLTAHLRSRRMNFLGKTLKLSISPTELAHSTLVAYHSHLASSAQGLAAFQGSIFADSPHPSNLNSLLEIAKDASRWRRLSDAENF